MKKIIVLSLFLLIAFGGWGQATADTISYTGSPLCLGANIQLVAKDSASWFSLQWKRDGVYIPGATNGTYTATQTGTYSIVVKASAAGIDSTYPNLLVTFKPSASFNFSPNSQCSSTPVSFTGTSSGNIATYAWDFGDPNSGSTNAASVNNPAHIFAGATGTGNQNFTVSLTITDNDGCSANTTHVVTTKQLPTAALVGPLPSVYDGKNYFSACSSASSASLSFRNSSTSSTATAYDINWGDGGSDFNQNSFSTTISHTFNVGTTPITYSITGANGCTGVANYYIFVGSNPSIGITNPGSTSICTGSSLTFPITFTNTPGTVYTAIFNDGSPSYNFDPTVQSAITHTFTTSSCGTTSQANQTYSNSFSASVTASNPCTQSSGTVVPIYVSDKPQALFTIPKDTTCVNTIIPLTNTNSSIKNVSANGSCTNGKSLWTITPGTQGVDWTVTAGTLGDDAGDTDVDFWTAGSTNLSVTFLTPGVYTIKLKSGGNATCHLDSTTKTICINPTPTASFTVNTQTGCAPLAVTTTNTSPAPNCGNNKYQWTVSYSSPTACTPNTSGYSYTNGTSATSINPQFLFNNPGVYTISLVTTSPGGCSSIAYTKDITVKDKPNVSNIASASTICQGSKITPSTAINNCGSATVATYLWTFNTGTPSTSTTATPGDIFFSTVGTPAISVAVTNECGTTTVNKSITVNPIPDVSVPANQSFCKGITTNALNFTSTLSGTTFAWANSNTAIGLGASGSSGTINSFTTTNTGSSPITATITVTPSNNNCSGTPVSFTITVNPVPTAPATVPVTYCQNASATALTASVSSGDSLAWYTQANGGTGSNSITPSTTSVGNITYYVSQANKNTLCESVRSSLVVTVNASPVIDSINTTNPTACAATDGKIRIYGGLFGNNQYTINYKKNSIAATPLSLRASNGVITITGLSSGNYTDFTVTLSGCTSPIIAGPFSLTDPNPPATPVVNSVAPICNGGSLVLSVVSPISNATYLWTGPSYNQTTTTGTVTINNATTAASGTYQVTVTMASCTSAPATVTATVNPTPALPVVTTPVAYCQGDVATTLASNASSGDTLNWYGTNATGGTASNTIPVPNTATAGTFKYYVSQTTTATGCESGRNLVTVTINPTPAAPTATNKTYCQGNTASALTATASTGNSLRWYTQASGGSGNTAAPTPGTTTVGTTSYYVSQVTSAGCESPRTQVDVTINETPATPVATTPVVYCQNAIAVPLNATNTGANILQWYTILTGTGSNTAPTPSTTTAGPTTYYVSQVTGQGCESSKTPVVVTINVTPAAPSVNTPVVYCENNTPVPLTATASGSNTLNWYMGSTGGTASTTAPAPVTSSIGSTNYYVSQTAATGSCEGPRAMITVTVNTTPVIDSVKSTNPSACATATGTLLIYGPLGNNQYLVSYKKNGTPVTPFNSMASNGVITISNLLSGSYTDFTVSILSCISNTLAGPVVLSDPTPPAIPVINSIAPVCSGNTLHLNSNSTTAGVTYTWTGPNNFTSAQQNPDIQNATTTASGTYAVTATLNSCISAAATITVRVDSTPATPVVTSNSPLCYGSTLNLASSTTFSGTLTYAWTGPNSFTNTSPTPAIANANETDSGDYTLTITAATGNCSATPATTHVIVRPLLTQALISGPDTVVVCHFAPPANATQALVANLNTSRSFETGKWSIISQPVGGSGAFANASQTSTTFTYAKSGIYQLQWAITNDINCPSTKDTVVLSVVDQPAITQNLTASSINVCAGNPVTIQVSPNAITGQIRYWRFKRPYTAVAWQDTLVTNPSITFNNVTDTFLVRLVVIATDQVHCSSDTAFKDISINVAPPSSPGISAGGNTVCQGANTGIITLTGNIGAPVAWQSSTDGISFTNIAASSGQNYTYTNLIATTWFRAAVKSGTCDTVFSNATKITVFPLVTPANAGTDAALCGDTTYHLTGNIPASLETGLWSFVQGSPVAIIQDPANANTLLSGLVPNTTYQLIWTLSNGICTATQDTVVIHDYLPLTNTIDTATITVCNGISLQVTGNLPAGGNQPYHYQWQLLQGTAWVDIAGATNLSYSFIADTTVTIRRLVTATPCATVSLVKTIYVQPPLGNNTITGNLATCINTSPGTLIGSLPSGGDGNYFYQWQMLQGTAWTNINGATQKDYAAPVLTVTTQYRRLITSALCSGSQGIYSTAFEVTVHPDAKAQWTITKDTGCAPFNISNTIIRPVLFPLQNASYAWYDNGTYYGNDVSSNPGYVLVPPADSVTIKMVAISLLGCKNDSLEHQFFTIPPVLTAFSRSDSIGCGPLTVNFINTTPYIGFFTYHWNFGNNTTSNAAQPGSMVFATNPNFGDTTYTITLTATSECESVSKTETVTVKSRPKAIFVPDKTNGCSPFAVNFTNVSKGLGITYLWNFGDGTTLAATTPQMVSHSFTTGVQDTFIVKLIAMNPCGNDTAMYNIVVSPNQVHLNFAVNGNETQGCKQHTVHFINATSGATNFEWNFGDGNTLSTTKNIDTVIHTYQQAGNFTVVLFATNGCSDTTTTRTIQVFNPPIANFTSAPLTTCIGDTIHFTNQTDTATSLLWNFKDGYTSSLTNPVHAYIASGTYEVQLKAFRQYNSGLSCADSINKPITIVAKLPGAFTVTDTISNCVPFTAIFTNQSIPSALTVWHFDNQTTDTGDIVTHTFTQTGTYQVKMDALDPGGCTYEASKNIIVRGPAGTWQYDHGTICNTTPVRFEVFATGTDSIRWNFGDSIITTTKLPVIYHSYLQPGKYVPTATLVSSLANGCIVLLPGTDTIKVDFIKAGYTSVKQADCDSTIIRFTDTSRHYTAITGWQWHFGDGSTSALQNPQHTYTITNTWTQQLIVTAASGCSDTSTAHVFIKVNNTPVSNIVATTQGCEDRIVHYTAQVVSADSVIVNSWKFSNGVMINGNAVDNIYATPGTYIAILITGTAYGCADTTSKNITINPVPSITASPDQLICKGQSLQLTAASTAGITWSPVDGTLSCTVCTNPVARPLTTTQYVATATNNFGCSNWDTVFITVAQPIQIVASPNDTICIGSSAQLFVTGATTYVWTPAATLTNPGTATPVATPTLTTEYQVIGFDNHHCFEDTAKVIVAVGQYPTIDLGSDKVVSTGTQLPLTYTDTNGPLTSWLWTPADNLSCNTCAIPVATVKKDICYTVVAANQYKCTATDTLCIKVFCEDTQVFIPNVFTPDHDGKNDILMVRGKGIKTVKSFRIFNRWGQVVFERGNINPNDPSQGWDGKVNGIPASPDVYIYTCEVVCENDISYTYNGNVAIIK